MLFCVKVITFLGVVEGAGVEGAEGGMGIPVTTGIAVGIAVAIGIGIPETIVGAVGNLLELGTAVIPFNKSLESFSILVSSLAFA